MDANWYKPLTISSVKFRCGFCGNVVASNKGYFSEDRVDGDSLAVYICPHCARPTFLHNGFQSPQVAPGNIVQHLPQRIEALYNEARQCVAVSAYTASVLACRKLLMNIAVEQGAKHGLKFIQYVSYLAEHGFVPPNGRGWVDHIRKKGNEATHEINLMKSSDAEELIAFVEMLLKFVYEFPAKIPKQTDGGISA